jgi:co-chaperonin GroES (HSP10)
MTSQMTSSSLAFMDIQGDQKAETLKALASGPATIKAVGHQVVTVIWMPPAKTKGGIYLTDDQKDESIWQGKVSLVVAVGPDAYNGGVHARCEEGDWIVTNPIAGQKLRVNNAYVRIINDDQVLAVVNGPQGVL